MACLPDPSLLTGIPRAFCCLYCTLAIQVTTTQSKSLTSPEFLAFSSSSVSRVSSSQWFLRGARGPGALTSAVNLLGKQVLGHTPGLQNQSLEADPSSLFVLTKPPWSWWREKPENHFPSLAAGTLLTQNNNNFPFSSRMVERQGDISLLP